MTESEFRREAPSPQPLNLRRAVVAAALRCVPRPLADRGGRHPSDLREDRDEPAAPASGGGVWLLIARGMTCLNDPRGHTGGSRD